MRAALLAAALVAAIAATTAAQTHTVVALSHEDHTVYDVDPASGRIVHAFKAAEQPHEGIATADGIAGKSLPSVLMAKEAVNRAFEVTLNEGLRFERRIFSALFATQDQKEGMAAFAEKRKADFQNR